VPSNPVQEQAEQLCSAHAAEAPEWMPEKMVKGGCVDLRMWQWVKDGCQCEGHPPFTHHTQPCLWTNEQCIAMY